MNRIVVVLLAAVLLSAPSIAMSNAAKAPAETCTTLSEPVDGVYMGLFREGAPANMEIVRELEKKVGKNFASVMWYMDWSSSFPADSCDKVAKAGKIPHIVWEPWLWSDKKRINLDSINKGEWDEHVRKWAKDIKKWGGFVFIRFAHEFNIEGYPWGIVNNGKNPKKYVDAFRRVKNIFKSEGATNAKFVWCPMNESWPQESWNDMHLAYPGDEYVDWIGIDGYNWGTTQDWSQWRSFKDLFRNVARDLWRRYPSKPIMIAEFASAPIGGDEAKWILDITSELKKMPYIKNINWFDLHKETDWTVNSSPKTFAAFKKMMNDSFYLSDSKGIDNVCSPSGMVVQRKKAQAKFASSALNIDGDLAEWEGVSPLVVDKLVQVQEGASVWKGPEDLSGKIYVKWDKDNLYIAGNITDNVPLMNPNKKQNVWKGDAIEVCIGLDRASDKNRASFSKSDHQMGFGVGDAKGNPPSIWLWTRNMEPGGAQIAVKRSAKAKGYTFETKIPWADMSGYVPSEGDTIAFDCALDDADSGQRAIQMVWNGDFLFYKDPGVWGELQFVK